MFVQNIWDHQTLFFILYLHMYVVKFIASEIVMDEMLPYCRELNPMQLI